MASRFQQVVEHVRIAMQDVRDANAHDRIADGSWLVGRLAATSHKAPPPYVAWIRGGGSIIHTKQKNPLLDGNLLISPLYDARHTVSALICGRDDEDTETIWYDLLAAVRNSALALDDLPGSFRWVTQEDDNAGYVRAGHELCIQDFVWPMLVPREIRSVTAIAASDHTCEIIP